MKLKESGEMYLETIWILKKESSSVRSVDIADYTGYSKPSVSRAVGLLKKDEYITVDKDGYISFTDKGAEKASDIYERHMVLSELFKKIGVSEDLATEDACKVEHSLSDETFQALKKLAEKM